ncbi:hypothetical protein B0H15DRAFT_484482 [Mycena belliarum]|uniref:tRNA(Ile)-lysidine synthetase n=1 Tax=Mycena belliarum TaxID=1033014 RepID=A0AAD6TYX5_9AGAR|nr:hypothetical protein B0H15DRAFT_484482 [Mycena belliae]
MSAVLTPKPLPISRTEFGQFFRRCAPPVGWTRKIAVATSGGPDSTCLLFLLNRYLRDRFEEWPQSLPGELHSITVDHGLQEGSDRMAQKTADFAAALGVPHVTCKVPWGEPPFPERPKSGEAFELLGRNVRYRLLFNAMHAMGINALALGHHVDDQVETSLMRLARGTTEVGAGGMRRVRRWGMGTNRESDLGWTGAEGMKKWLLRPLLEVSKDRILATCEENQLEYVTDHTNFQPELTLRNAIRYLLSKNTLDPEEISVELRPDIADSLSKIKEGIASLESVDMDISNGTGNLRSAVMILSDQAEDIDSLVDTSLNRCHLPSPPGTYLVSYRGLATVNDPLVKRGLILRIMRYVSFHAWGTTRADANRRRESLERIIMNLWTPDPFAARIAPFVGGGGVFWTPVLVDSGMRIPVGRPTPRPGEIIGWLASRQPPMSLVRMTAMGIHNPLRVDVTDQLHSALLRRAEEPGQVIELLWDTRFTVRMDVDKIPEELARGILEEGDEIKIHPNTRWYWPQVIRAGPRLGFEEEVLHSTLSVPEQESIVKLDRDTIASWPYVRIDRRSTDWIRAEWIRSLSAI